MMVMNVTAGESRERKRDRDWHVPRWRGLGGLARARLLLRPASTRGIGHRNLGMILGNLPWPTQTCPGVGALGRAHVGDGGGVTVQGGVRAGQGGNECVRTCTCACQLGWRLQGRTSTHGAGGAVCVPHARACEHTCACIQRALPYTREGLS